ncbi:hypothetical protein BLSTO_03851 [Blastocystis sp. subtype 1]
MFTKLTVLARKSATSVSLLSNSVSCSSMQLARFFASTLPEHITVAMPALSPTMTQGGIASWNVKEGDAVQPGDVLAQISTDKSTLDFTTQEEVVPLLVIHS